MKFSSVLLLTAFSCLLQEAQDFLDHYRDVLAKNKMIQNKGIYKRWRQLTRTIVSNHQYQIKDKTRLYRYEIDWIGREGLACETHDEFLRVGAIVHW